MKSFIATSNGLYIQDLELPEGTWIFSAIVKSPNQQYAFAIQEGSVWREFEVPLHTTSYRKISKSFVTTGVSKINIISKYASASNTIELVAPMLEGGTIGTPAKKHELDIVEAIQDQEIYVEYSVDGSTDWHTTFATGDLYMRQKKGTGNWSSAIRIVGEKGATGNEGRYKSFEFAKNTSLTVPPPSNANWTDAPPTIDVGEFLWMRSGEVIPPATTPTKWDVVRIGGEKGDDGQDGSDGTSVLSVVYQYALKDKPAEGVTPTAPTTGWSVDRPAWEANKDLWVRTLTTYSDNSTSTGTPVLDKTWISEGKVIAVEDKTDFLTTDINGNVMATGTLLVGQNSTTNAGITGTGDPQTGLFLWGGATYANRLNAPFYARRNGEVFASKIKLKSSDGSVEWEMENGIQKWYDISVTPRVLRRQIGWDSTGPKDQTFGVDGTLLYEFTAGGFKSYAIPAKATAQPLLSLGNLSGQSTTEATLANTVKPLIKNYLVTYPDQVFRDEGGMEYLWRDEYWGLYLKNSMTAYIFNSGTETSLKDYDGYRTGNSANPPSQSGNNFIADGWYVDYVAVVDPPDPQNMPNMMTSAQNADPYLQLIWKQQSPVNYTQEYWESPISVHILCMYILNGKNIVSKTAVVSMTYAEYSSLSR